MALEKITNRGIIRCKLVNLKMGKGIKTLIKYSVVKTKGSEKIMVANDNQKINGRKEKQNIPFVGVVSSHINATPFE